VPSAAPSAPTNERPGKGLQESPTEAHFDDTLGLGNDFLRAALFKIDWTI